MNDSRTTVLDNQASLKPQSVLVIGYGNTLRSDDGVGQVVAVEVQRWELPGVRSLCVHQLTPELAEILANSSCAIFVDAYPAMAAEAVVQVSGVEPIETSSVALGHSSNPRSLLALTQALYGYSPPSWCITIPAVNFEFGEGLSPIAQQGVADALNQIHRLFIACNQNV